MQANKFAILENKDKLSHAYLCYGDFKSCEDVFTDSLAKSGIKLRSPGHFVFEEDTFGVGEARELVSWYNSGQTSNDDTHTVAVIASSVIKKDAQQMLLKVLEEAKHPYTFFIFAKPGTEIIDTVISRSQVIHLGFTEDKEIKKFIEMPVGERMKKVAADIKGFESSEVRDYTEALVRGMMFHFSKENTSLVKQKIALLLKIQKVLTESYIAPKFILDYVITVV